MLDHHRNLYQRPDREHNAHDDCRRQGRIVRVEREGCSIVRHFVMDCENAKECVGCGGARYDVTGMSYKKDNSLTCAVEEKRVDRSRSFRKRASQGPYLRSSSTGSKPTWHMVISTNVSHVDSYHSLAKTRPWNVNVWWRKGPIDAVRPAHQNVSCSG